MLRKIILLSTIIFLSSGFLSGCQNQPAAAGQTNSKSTQTETAQPSLTPLPSATALPTNTPTPTATPAPLGCAELKGRVEQRQMEDKILGKPLEMNIYLPPCYDTKKSGSYPVLILMHGQSYTDSQWVDLGVPDTADRLMTSGQIAPFLVVMPQEDYYLKDLDQSKFGESVSKRLLPWVQRQYNACSLRECNAIGGLSRGAIWAVSIGLRNGDVFGSVGAHSLASNPFQTFILRDLLKSYPVKPRIYLDSGEMDQYLKSALDFEDTLNQLHVQHTWILRDGTHNDQYWASHVEEYLRWYAMPWRK
jgi:enterochelin esterase-like enzyme